MAKQKSSTDQSTDGPKRARSGENLNVWIRSDLVEAVRQFCLDSSPRTTKTAVVETALLEFLAARGIDLPPPPKE